MKKLCYILSKTFFILSISTLNSTSFAAENNNLVNTTKNINRNIAENITVNIFAIGLFNPEPTTDLATNPKTGMKSLEVIKRDEINQFNSENLPRSLELTLSVNSSAKIQNVELILTIKGKKSSYNPAKLEKNANAEMKASKEAAEWEQTPIFQTTIPNQNLKNGTQTLVIQDIPLEEIISKVMEKNEWYWEYDFNVVISHPSLSDNAVLSRNVNAILPL